MRESASAERARCAIEGVLLDSDLVALILAGNIGPSGFAAVSLVCKSWLSVCRGDKRVLRGVALYQGGLTKGVFMKLFAVSSPEAGVLPHTTHRRYGGGTYFLYGEGAVNAILSAGGMKAWRNRLRVRAESSCIPRWPLQLDCIRRASQREERLRARAASAVSVA